MTLSSQIIDAGEEQKAIADRIPQVGDSANIFGRSLDRHELRLVGQFREHARRDVHGIGGGLLNHDRQVGRLGHGSEVRHRLAAVGLRDHRRAAPSSHRRRPSGLPPRNDKRPAVVHSATPVINGTRPAITSRGCPNDSELFLRFQRAVLANGAEHDHAVNAGLDHRVQVLAVAAGTSSD